MRMKLIALVGAGLLLAGCGAEPAPESEAASPVSEEPVSEWDGKTFCETFEAQREDYQDTLDSDEPLEVSALAPYEDWASALKTAAGPETAEAVATFTAPIYLTEDSTVDLMDVFMAGNELGGYCITG